MIRTIKSISKKIRRAKFSKRAELVLVTAFLTVGLIATQVVSFEDRAKMILGLGAFTLFLSALALRENLKGVKRFTLLILPPFFSVAVGLFYFLLPVRWLTRLPFAGLFSLGMYALLLTENIYNVATERSIGLLRVAQSVGLLLTLVTYFLLAQIVFSFHFSSFFNFLLIFVFSFFLAFQALWAVRLGERVRKELLYSFVIALCLAEFAFVFSFWPIKPTIEALFLTATFYVFVGAAQHFLLGRLFQKAVREFFLVLLVVFSLLFLTTNWR